MSQAEKLIDQYVAELGVKKDKYATTHIKLPSQFKRELKSLAKSYKATGIVLSDTSVNIDVPDKKLGRDLKKSLKKLFGRTISSVNVLPNIVKGGVTVYANIKPNAVHESSDAKLIKKELAKIVKKYDGRFVKVEKDDVDVDNVYYDFDSHSTAVSFVKAVNATKKFEGSYEGDLAWVWVKE